MDHSHSHDHSSSSTTIAAVTGPGGKASKYKMEEEDDCCGCAHDHAEPGHHSSADSSHNHEHGHDHNHTNNNNHSSESCCGDSGHDHGHSHGSHSPKDDCCSSGSCGNKCENKESSCCSNNSNNSASSGHDHGHEHGHNHSGSKFKMDEGDDCCGCAHDHDSGAGHSHAHSGHSSQAENMNQPLMDHSHGHGHGHEHSSVSSSPTNVDKSVEMQVFTELGSVQSAIHQQTCISCDPVNGKLKHESQSTRIRIANLCCAGEERIIRNSLDNYHGVESVSVNILGRYIVVKHCPANCCAPADKIVDILNKQRLGASVQEALGQEEEGDTFEAFLKENLYRWIYVTLLILILIAGSACQDALEKEEKHEFFISSTVLYAIGIFLGIIPVIQGAWIAIQRCTIDIHVLILVAVIGALASAEYFDACIAVTLFILAEVVEEIALQKVRSVVKLGVGLGRPSNFVFLPDGSKKALEKVVVNDIVCCRAGDSVPIDGVVSKGECVVNESALTGESMPVSKTVGSQVQSGTIVQNGYVEVRVTVPVEEGTYQKLQKTVDLLQTDRGQYAKLVDRFAVYWTPTVISFCVLLVVIGGGITKDWHKFVMHALIVLVLACPCAILLAAPLPTVCAIATAAKYGVLIKGASVIERTSTINSVAVDKTGTLTKGFFKVLAKETFNSDLDYRPLELAAAIESKSSHPLANAIVSDFCGCIAEMEADLPNAKNIKVIEGVGISGWVNAISPSSSSGKKASDNWLFVRIGNERLLQSHGGDLELSPSAEAKLKRFTETYGRSAVVVLVAVEDSVDLVMALADEVREEAKEFIKQLHTSNIGVTMLTGDHSDVAEMVAKNIGISVENCKSRLMPHEKLGFIENLQNAILHTDQKNVLMIGDGINDAAALTKARVGVAMGEGGAAMAVECADVIIMSDNLLRIPATISLSKSCNRIVIENVAVSLAIKIAAIVLASTGYLPFWAAVLTDIGSLVIVLINASRLLFTDVYSQSSLDSIYRLSSIAIDNGSGVATELVAPHDYSKIVNSSE